METLTIEQLFDKLWADITNFMIDTFYIDRPVLTMLVKQEELTLSNDHSTIAILLDIDLHDIEYIQKNQITDGFSGRHIGFKLINGIVYYCDKKFIELTTKYIDHIPEIFQKQHEFINSQTKFIELTTKY
jgi:hypothetical protein